MAKKSFKMGSMIIVSVDGKQTMQYVQGMPKIHYLDGKLKEKGESNILEKRDGTNIVFFPLIVGGKVIEVLTKTRGMPTAENFKDKLDRVDTSAFKEFVREEKLSLAAELFGYENPHTVDYGLYGIALELEAICALEQGRGIPYREFKEKAMNYGLPTVPEHGVFRGDVFIPLGLLLAYIGPHAVKTTPEQLYSDLEKVYEEINNIYRERYSNRDLVFIEGAVWHVSLGKELKMIKNKATSVKELHITIAKGVPKHVIKKAVLKVKEMGYEIENTPEFRALVEEELLEEISPEVVRDRKTQARITSVIEKTRAEELTLDRLREIAREVEEVTGKDADPAEKMRVFARKYPELKKLSGKIYRVFTGGI